MLIIVPENIIITGAQYLAHQTNCVSNGPAGGLAYYLFNLFPYADCYRDRMENSVPGTIDVRGNGLSQRYIINMHAQFYPGGPVSGEIDNEKLRRQWFHECLVKISEITDLQSIAFPYGIGCGLGGGDWNWYMNHLEKFEQHINKSKKVDILLYKLEE